MATVLDTAIIKLEQAIALKRDRRPFLLFGREIRFVVWGKVDRFLQLPACYLIESRLDFEYP